MASAIWRKTPRLVFKDKEDDSFEHKPPPSEPVADGEQVELDWIKVDKTHAFKTVFLGDPNVGKTCLARMFVDREVLEQSCNTVGFDHHMKQVQVEEGLQVKLQVWDTAGMEQFRNALITKYYRNADGIILVYDITRRQTFENINLWVNEVRTYIGLETVKVALIGNKLDQSSSRQVTPVEGQALADRYGMSFYELSAKDVKQLPKLEEIFSTLARDMFEERQRREVTLSRSGIIRLAQEPEDWILVDAPDDPIPRSTYAAQEMKARLQTLVPKRFRKTGDKEVTGEMGRGSRGDGHTPSQRVHNHGKCTCV